MKRTEEFENKLGELILEFCDLSYSDLETTFEYYADRMAELKEKEGQQ